MRSRRPPRSGLKGSVCGDIVLGARGATGRLLVKTEKAGESQVRTRQYVLGTLKVLAACVLLLVIAAVAGLAGVAVGATKGMKPLAALQTRPVAQTTMIYDRTGRFIGRVHGATDRVNVNSAQIPLALKRATIAIEDKRFYDHHGVDIFGIARAALADLRAGHVVQGGSTITQQYIKNAYLGDAGGLVRKIREAALAWQLENSWSKDRILTAYLNTVYYGSGAYGVEAASRRFFHEQVWRLDLAQCALLAALPRLPSGYSPITDPQDARSRRSLVLRQMWQQGYITAHQLAVADKAKLGVFKRAPGSVRGPAAYFVDYVTRQLVNRYGVRATFEGGLRVYTTLDMRMQRAGIKALAGTLPAGPAGALVSIDPVNGFVRAMVATTDFRKTQFDLAWQAHRQLGSAMKPFALTAAVAQGADPATTFYSSHPLHLFLGQGAVPPFWDVRTFSNTYAGRINLQQATWQSDNTVYAQLALDVGPRNIVRVAHRMGIRSKLSPYPSIVLGTEAVTPLEVADAYATFAAEGVHHAPQAIARVVFPGGRVATFAPHATRAIPAGVAYVVDKVLQGNTRFGTAAAIPSYYSGVAAGKTGTTENSADAWFCGFNPKLATAVWMGYPQAEVPMPGVQGATYCVPVWGKYYAAVFGSRKIADFRRPLKMPVFVPWTGKYSLAAGASPAPSATPGATTTPGAVPTPGATVTPSHTPTPTPSTTG
jgi:penicillin-binding protein 1A